MRHSDFVISFTLPASLKPAAAKGRARQFRLAGLRDGWAWAPRHWREVTDDTGTGDPKAATVEKGEKFLRAVAERIGGFLVDLAKADVNNMYE